MEINLVTGNNNKAREFQKILRVNLNRIDIDLKEIQSISVEEVAIEKAKRAYEAIKKPVIVEDTGLYIESLNGFPGALSKIFTEILGMEKITEMVGEKRGAVAKTAIAYSDGKNTRVFTGKIKGKISESPKGEDNFGWDVIFIPKGHKKTFAQIGERKHNISMRKKALLKLDKFLSP